MAAPGAGSGPGTGPSGTVRSGAAEWGGFEDNMQVGTGRMRRGDEGEVRG